VADEVAQQPPLAPVSDLDFLVLPSHPDDVLLDLDDRSDHPRSVLVLYDESWTIVTEQVSVLQLDLLQTLIQDRHIHLLFFSKGTLLLFSNEQQFGLDII